MGRCLKNILAFEVSPWDNGQAALTETSEPRVANGPSSTDDERDHNLADLYETHTNQGSHEPTCRADSKTLLFAEITARTISFGNRIAYREIPDRTMQSILEYLQGSYCFRLSNLL